MDQLEISSLRIKTHIGVYPWEQRIMQEVLVDLCLSLPAMTRSDDLATTVDYDSLCQQITTTVAASSFQLIETLAEHIAQYIKQHYPQIQTVSVRVSKPQAIPAAKNVSIYIQR